jgi:glycosyltransferase involved in cell wall biosynthesis
MSLKFKNGGSTVQGENEVSDKKNKINSVIQKMSKDIPTSFSSTSITQSNLGIPFAPLGSPSTAPNVKVSSIVKKQPPPPPVSMPGSDLKRAVFYGADLGGCNAWRLGYPAFLMNYNGKAIINELSSMVVDPRFYPGIKSVTVQRQATDVQKAFLHFITDGGRELGFKINYEIDDIVFKEDIPEYNRCKFAFEDPKIRSQIQDMMGMVDEITVTCDYMKEYYKHKTSNPNVTVIPNYIPKFWADGFYNEDEIYRNYEKNKDRPRILYAGSGTHFDVVNKTGQKDDFEHVIQNIIKARKKYKFVFMGGFPHAVKPYIDNGEMEFVQWVPLLELFSGLHSVGANATYAPLQDNVFNKSKSNIKLLEAGALGLPCVAQDLCTYDKAHLKFKTGNDLIDRFDQIFKDENTFMENSKKQREYTESMWLENENNWMKRYEATFYKIGDPNRKYILETNPEQKIN